MYKRNVYYSNESHQFVPWLEYGGYSAGADGLGTKWERQIRISALSRQYWNRGYCIEGDMQSFFSVIKNSAFQYCQAEPFFKDFFYNRIPNNCYQIPDNSSLLKYLELYSRYPSQTELLVKRGLGCIIQDKIHGVNTEPAICWTGKTTRSFLRFTLTKEDKKYLQKKQYKTDIMNGLNMLAVLQAGGRNRDTTFEEACLLCTTLPLDKMKRVRKNIPDIQKTLQYIKKIEKRDNWESRWYNIAFDYFDYLQEIQELGYDMKDKKNLWPRDFAKAHSHTSKLMRIIQTQKQAERQKAKNKQWEETVSARARKLKKYEMEAGPYFIRPIQTVEEMIQEGAVNHNCVAMYIEPYATGKTNILVIRKKAAPNTPFYTMEVKNNEIIQCRTNCNRGVQESDLKTFIQLFEETRLNKKFQRKDAVS